MDGLIAGRFEIEKRVAGGGMGEIFRARDHETALPVAIKLLRDEGTQARLRFAREVRVLAAIVHPGIVGHVAHGTTDDGRPWLAMEWLDGEDLQHRLRRGPLDARDAVALGIAVAEALGAAHEAGLVHRDVKPSNLLLVGGDPRRPKLVDFGIVRGLATTALATSTHAAMGTPAYLAPEQLRSARDVDARADVYSLGAVLYECISGRTPFEAENLMALLAKVVLEEAPRLSERCPDVAADLDETIARLLAKDPANRPADGRAVAAELRALDPAAPAALAQVRTGIGSSEQRLVTLVLVREGPAIDPTVATLDPNTAGPVGASAHLLAAIDRAIEGTGATVHGLLASSAVLTFAGAGSATDAAVRAAASATAIVTALPDASAGIATGRATLSERMPLGEAIDRAARLLAAARPGESRADALTAELIATRFELGSEGDDVILGGRREIEMPRTVLGRAAPFVGRDAELALLEAQWSECENERHPRVALVTAPAGAGKSRLRDALIARIAARGARIWMARPDPVRPGAPLDLVAQLVRAATGVRERARAEEQRSALHAHLEAELDPGAYERSAEILGEVVGAPLAAEPSPRLRAARADPADMADRVRRALADLIAAVAARQPLALVLDDLHWADASSVAAIDGALRDCERSPVLLLALSRPETSQRLGSPFARHHPIEVRLPPLRRGACERLVQALLPDAPADVVARVVEQSEGNALFLEELIRAAAAGRAPGAGASNATVLAMLGARLDALEPEARMVLRAASVVGETFWTGAVRALIRVAAPKLDVRASLEQLVDREVLVRRPDSRFAGEAEYRFRHALLHEAAAAMLADADRRAGHRAAAAWLEAVGSRDARAIADHHERAGQPLAAVPWWLSAARAALAVNALDEAAALARKVEAARPEGESLADAYALIAESERWLGRNDAAIEAATEAMALLPRGGLRWFGAAIEAAIAAQRLGRQRHVAVLAQEVLGAEPADADAREERVAAAAVLAQALLPAGHSDAADALLALCGDAAAIADPWLRARVLAAHAAREGQRGAVSARLDFALAACAALRECGHERALAQQLVNLGHALGEIGSFAEAEAQLREAIGASERLGLTQVEAAARLHLGRMLAALDRLEEARVELEAAKHALDAAQNRRFAAAARLALASLDEAAGDHAAAEAHARAACERLAGDEQLPARALLARQRARRGEAAAALAEVHAIAASLDREGAADGDAAIRLAHAEVAHAAGARDEACDVIRRATERIHRRADAIPSRKRRHDFMNIPIHRRTFALDVEWNG